MPNRTAMLPSGSRVRPIVGVPTAFAVAHDPPYCVPATCAGAATAAPSAAVAARVPTARALMRPRYPAQGVFSESTSAAAPLLRGGRGGGSERAGADRRAEAGRAVIADA